jgi:hypothetical protein
MEEVTTGAWHLQSSFARLCYPARLPGLPPMLRQPGRGAAPQGPPRGAPGDGDAWSGGRQRLPTRCPGLGLRSCEAPPGLVGRTATRTPAAPAAGACTVPAAAGGSREGFVPGGQESPFPPPGGARAGTACCQPSGGGADAGALAGGARAATACCQTSAGGADAGALARGARAATAWCQASGGGDGDRGGPHCDEAQGPGVDFAFVPPQIVCMWRRLGSGGAGRRRPRCHCLLPALGRLPYRSPHRRRASLFPPFIMWRSHGSAWPRRLA